MDEPQNLTAVTSIADGVDRHLADSLAFATLDHAGVGQLCDIGSGGGMPGLVIAQLMPHVNVTCVESEQRKAQWLMRAAEGLTNVRVVPDRSETLATSERERFDVVTARAVAPAPVVLELVAPLVAVGGRAIVWSSNDDVPLWQRCEPVARELGFDAPRVHPVQPFPDARRALIELPKRRPTDPRFPRRPGRAAKRPLLGREAA